MGVLAQTPTSGCRPGFLFGRSSDDQRQIKRHQTMDSQQLREHIIAPALAILGDKYATDSAVTLLLATAAQESACGRDVRQIGGGPARGPYQMEGATLHDLYANYLAYHPAVAVRIGIESAERMVYDWRYATQTARLQYWRFPDSLPQPADIDGMWRIYKRRWNTELGAATREQFVDNWQRFVAPTLH